MAALDVTDALAPMGASQKSKSRKKKLTTYIFFFTVKYRGLANLVSLTYTFGLAPPLFIAMKVP